jgi:cytochrome oxidase assembly protein ShyY1
MYRFLLRPKWILFHVVVFSAAIGMLGLAKWQWNRHLERDAFVSSVRAKEALEPTELTPLLADSTPGDIEYRRVTASGTYVDGPQLVEILRTQDGVNGVNVLTPFQIDGGPIVIVNRGFVANGQPVPDPPAGTLRIGGTARRSEVRRTGELTDNNDGATTEVRRIDLPVIATKLGITVAPVYIDFIASEPASPTPPSPVPVPNLSGGPPHVSYTVQWIIFSIAVVVGWVFAIRRSRRNQDRAAAKAAAAGAVTGSGTDADADAVSDERPVQPSA